LVAVLQDLENDLRADVVREVTDDGKRSFEKLAKIQLQQITDDEPVLQLWIVCLDMGSCLSVELNAPEVDVLAVDQVFGEGTRSWPNFDHGPIITVMGKGFGNAPCNVVLLEKVLAKALFRPYIAHASRV
jgi:hypothetical protein